MSTKSKTKIVIAVAASTSIAMVFIVFGFIISEHARCKNTNPAFEKYTIADEAYKKELADRMTELGTKNIRFTFNGYERQGKTDCMVVSLKGKSLCADLTIEVKDWKTFEFLKTGDGYSGAELRGLDLAVVRMNKKTHFILNNIAEVVD